MKTAAQKRSIEKWNKKAYKQVACRFRIQDVNIYSRFAEKNNISTNGMITSCINYCINNNIDISGGVKLDSSDTTPPDETD